MHQTDCGSSGVYFKWRLFFFTDISERDLALCGIIRVGCVQTRWLSEIGLSVRKVQSVQSDVTAVDT